MGEFLARRDEVDTGLDTGDDVIDDEMQERTGPVDDGHRGHGQQFGQRADHRNRLVRRHAGYLGHVTADGVGVRTADSDELVAGAMVQQQPGRVTGYSSGSDHPDGNHPVSLSSSPTHDTQPALRPSKVSEESTSPGRWSMEVARPLGTEVVGHVDGHVGLGPLLHGVGHLRGLLGRQCGHDGSAQRLEHRDLIVG